MADIEDIERAARMAQWWLCVIEGYNDALAGKPFEHCMYEGQERIAWKHGWRSRAWAAQDEVHQPKCICGGEPHVSHCPACTDPFLKVSL